MQSASPNINELVPALETALKNDRITVIVLETHKEAGVPSYETWWDVPICETSDRDTIQRAREQYDQHRRQERHFLEGH